MNKIFFAASLIILISIGAFKLKPAIVRSIQLPPAKDETSKIQVAILLDVSSSMDGLIDQAKAQLWNMVSIMGKAKCDGKTPQIEIALYEYGRPDNGLSAGYIKKVSGFTNDLDMLSKKLFSLKTNGGNEYCGKVILTSLDDLSWDSNSKNYKVIFISGNEDFLQGDVSYTKACALAQQKGVIVNTIYCGDRMQGIREHWNLNSECGNGSFTNIDQDAKSEEIPTPYDSMILTLNTQLNGTYISYGRFGAEGYADQANVDKLNMKASSSVALQRVAVKGKKELYKNSRWDAVDAYEHDSRLLETVDVKTLPDSFQNKSREELKTIITQKKNERTEIQNKIGELSAKREKFIAENKIKSSANTATLETEIEKSIRRQAKLFRMIIP